MTKTRLRNSAFVQLIRNNRNTVFVDRLLEFCAFASGAGCVFKFSSDYFELWSNASPSARLVYQVSRANE